MESTRNNKLFNSYENGESTESPNGLSNTLSQKKVVAPKRGKSSYLFFCSDERGKISSEFPTLKAKEVTIELGVRWKSLKENNPQMVSHYEKLAKEDKARYEAEKLVLPLKEMKVNKRKVSKKDRTGPKRGKSSYLFFCSEERANVSEQNPYLKAKEITTELGIRWQLLKERNPEKVRYFEGLAAQDKARYESEKLKPSSPTVDTSLQTSVNKHRVKGFQVFCQDVRRDYISSEKSARQITDELTLLWKNLPKNVQREYKDRAKSM